MKRSRLVRLLSGTTALCPLLAVCLADIAAANPTGGEVVAGEAVIAPTDPSTLTINQASQNTIINWQRFNIAPGETTRFVQPNGTAWALNRVTGTAAPSQILGTLEANGNVAIVNPDGILFGRNARVDVGGLVATTHDIANDDFMAGRFHFNQPGNRSASIVNEGDISIADYGLAAFVAPGVRNSGTITARLGSVGMASANSFTLDLYGDDLINLTVGEEILDEVVDVSTGEPVADLVKNDGTISADGGTVALTAATARRAVNSAINNTGVIEANTVGMRGGKIVLGAQTASSKTTGAPVQRVKVSGQLLAKNVPIPTPRPDYGTGGHIAVTGEMIEVANAAIDASGEDGGGTILVGGDYMGGNGDPTIIAEHDIKLEESPVPTAALVLLDEHSTIRADALGSGDGGKIIAWADEALLSAATLTARGGEQSGDGGFIETSGKYLEVIRAADASAPSGEAGTWLLDPINLSIRRTGSQNIGVSFDHVYIGYNGLRYDPTASPSIVSASLLEAALNGGNNVIVTTRGSPGSQDGDIRLEADINKTSGGDAIFHINAADDIRVQSGVDVTSTSGRLLFVLAATDGRIIGNNVGRIDVNGGQFHMEGGDGVFFDSNYDMPDNFSLAVNSLGPSPNSVVDIDVSFDDDEIKFSHDNDTATVRSGGVKLTDATATGNTFATLNNLNVLLEDNAFQFAGPRNWNVFIDPDKFVAVPTAFALNEKPEIILDQNFQFGMYGRPPDDAAPVLEVSFNGQPYVSDHIYTYGTGPSALAQELSSVVAQVGLQDIIDRYADPNAPQSVYEPTSLFPQATPTISRSMSPAQNASYGATKGTIVVTVAGESRTLRAYSNAQPYQGGFTEGFATGDYQCVELIQRYAGLFTGTSRVSGLGNGKDVAANLPNKTGGAFTYIPNGSETEPIVGSVISIELDGELREFGHVGIAQAVRQRTSDTIEVTLFDQNWPTDVSGNWKTVTFSKQSDGTWKGTMLNNGRPMDVVGWSNPA